MAAQPILKFLDGTRQGDRCVLTIRLDFYNEGISVGYTSVKIYNSLIMSQIYNYFFTYKQKHTFYYELNFKK